MPRGGKREGAGRKPSEEPKVPLNIKVSPDVREYVASLGIGNQGPEIERIIERTAGFRRWKESRK